MTSWGWEAYLERGVPVMREAIERRQPPLLLANHALLDLEHEVFPPGRYGHLLTPDRKALQSSFIHHWGPDLRRRGEASMPLRYRSSRSLDLWIAGRYTLESRGSVRY